MGGASCGPRFAETVEPNGYAWWYVDAFSADHRYGLTIIAFIGSVFSPYYAKERRRAIVDPAQHCSINVAVYGRGAARWAMTERCRHALGATPEQLAIGPSSLSWDGTRLIVRIDEKAPVTGLPVRGVVTLEPEIRSDFATDFGTDGRHLWAPIAPRARVEARFDAPAISWTGTGYFDTNRGDEPLEDGFSYWNWSRACLSDSAVMLYEGTRQNGSKFNMGIQIAADGSVSPVELRERCDLPLTRYWKMPRETRVDAGHTANVEQTLEDTPFYSRSMIATHLLGEPVHAMHESVSLDRFRKRWVQSLLGWRMPRVTLQGSSRGVFGMSRDQIE
ncbi:carotenoid 1,2-hydratase [Rhodomicrobium udaipurense]|uniref:Carotenoid 1,2-hydratase n=2 Tax=Rhodomicrobium udaipurense TaxID=1202716 RepID=A0A8I1GHZ0_9HYPH|nr:carotenoid 1,2-hydratase [Rhodomicrobium udaipurense]MBJ7544486.1 carotenoid 1,2-hydratase [Rhodomicrobium udaipurense]